MRNYTISPYSYTDFSIFSQAASVINSSLTLNNALTCTNLTCNGRINFPVGSLGTNYSGLWPDSGTPTSTDWYGFGMNNATLV